MMFLVEEADALATITTAFSTGLAEIKETAFGMIGAALPVALPIAGVGIAVILGLKFFKKVAK